MTNTEPGIDRRIEPTIDEVAHYRPELTGYCYRMLGSASDAEDAVQETMVRAWRSAHRFEGRSSLRTWLYRIATNICLDEIARRQRRRRPVDIGAPSTVATARLVTHPHESWVEPIPDELVVSSQDDDPSDLVARRDSFRLALVAALQHLPARQRAVLILREVLGWSAAEVAVLLETSVPAINSVLQRARATLDAIGPDATDVLDPADATQRALLDRYVDAFERFDMDALRALLHEDATMSMPPFSLWLRGREEIIGWNLGPGAECRGSRLVRTIANGAPAFGQYRVAASGDGHDPWSLTVLDVRGDRIVGVTAFLDTDRLFPMFGLPPRLRR